MTVFVPESIKVLGSDAGGASVVLCDMFVDDLADLPAPDAYTGYKLSMGCTATVINDNSKHRINSAGQWVQIVPGSSTYTRAEIDSIIARIDAEYSDLWEKINNIKRTYRVMLSSTPVNGIYFGVQMFPFLFETIPDGTITVENVVQGGAAIDQSQFTAQMYTWGFRIYTRNSTYAGLIPNVKIS